MKTRGNLNDEVRTLARRLVEALEKVHKLEIRIVELEAQNAQLQDNARMFEESALTAILRR